MSAAPPSLIDSYLATWSPRVESELDRLLPREDTDPTVVHAAMRYSVLAGGKRLRPALVLIGAQAAQGDEASVLGIACAVELVHTYSLIHDDLPAMDDDDLRRGRPSCHKQFGEAMAILAGDALNTFAFEVLARTAPDPSRIPALVLSLCRAAGTGGMVGGQVADLTSEGAVPDIAMVRSIHERKTAALLGCSLELGALAVGGDDELVARVGACGRGLGLAFQIVDDVLDEEGLAGDLGKTPGKDRQRGKLTYPAAVGIEQARRDAAACVHAALDATRGLAAQDLLASLGALILSRRT